MDTNVLYQALRSSAGASHYILQLLCEKKIEIAISIEVFLEYEEVITCKSTLDDLGLDTSDVWAVLDFIAEEGS